MAAGPVRHRPRPLSAGGAPVSRSLQSPVLSSTSRSVELADEQRQALLRLRDYPHRIARLRRLWIDINLSAGPAPAAKSAAPRRGSSRLAVAGASTVRRSASVSAGRRFEGAGVAPPLTRRQIQDLMTRDLTPEDYELLCLLDEAVPKRGVLSASAAAALPRAEPGGRWCGEDCGVCLCGLEPDEDVRILCACGHCFHGPCIEHWLTTSKASCPLCLAPVRAGGT